MKINSLDNVLSYLNVKQLKSSPSGFQICSSKIIWSDTLKESPSFPARSLTPEEMKRFYDSVRDNSRHPCIVDNNIVASTETITFNGINHSAVFTLSELESTDIIEQFVEEFSDQFMNWKQACDHISRLRSKMYAAIDHQEEHSIVLSRAFYLRVNGLRVEQRLLELCELLALKTGSEEGTSFTNSVYWQVKDMKTLDVWINFELNTLSSEITLSTIRKLTPWLMERFFRKTIIVLAEKIETTRRLVKQSNSESSIRELISIRNIVESFDSQKPEEWNWIESRKPSVNLRSRFRIFRGSERKVQVMSANHIYQ